MQVIISNLVKISYDLDWSVSVAPVNELLKCTIIRAWHYPVRKQN